MKKISFANLLIILSLFLTQDIHAADIDLENRDRSPTHVDARCKVFESYYLKQPDNKDPSIFDHMRGWHDEDFGALDRWVKVPENKAKLQTIRGVLLRSFDDKTVTHSKIAVAYMLYSMVISSYSELTLQGRADDAEEDGVVDRTIAKGLEYIEKKGLPDYNPNPTELYQLNNGLGMIIRRDVFGLRWTPYVAPNRVTASYRTLNSQFGMKAPLGGLPLNRKDYDGHLDRTPHDFLCHEAKLGGFYDAGISEVVELAYDYYRRADAIVREIRDPSVQFLCDFFLYETGYKGDFGIWGHGGGKELKAGEWVPLPNVVVRPQNFEEVCDKRLRRLEEKTKKICLLVPYEDYKPFNVNNPANATKKKWVENLVLAPFVNSETGQLFSLVEIINRLGLPKNIPLHKEAIANQLAPGYLSSLSDSQRMEFEAWVLTELNLNFYNELIGVKESLNEMGINFEVWKGDDFQPHGIIAFFNQACAVFKREVSPGFKVLDQVA